MKSFGPEAIHTKVMDYHDVVQFHRGGPEVYIQRPVKDRDLFVRPHAVTMEHGGPTFTVLGDEGGIRVPYVARLTPQMNDDLAAKQEALYGLGEAALTFGTGGGWFVGRVGFKNAALPLLERTGVKTLMTATQLMGQAGRAAKGSDLGWRDWLTIGVPVGWNKKNPLFQRTLGVLVDADAKNHRNLTERTTEFQKAQEIALAFKAIDVWLKRTTSGRRVYPKPPVIVNDDSSGGAMAQFIRDEFNDRLLKERNPKLEAYKKALNTLENVGIRTGLINSDYYALNLGKDAQQIQVVSKLLGELPNRTQAADKLKSTVAELSNLDSGLKVALRWLGHSPR